MNNRKRVLYILLTVFGLVLLYNYLIAPILIQYSTGMGMGMHWRMYEGSAYFIDMRYFLLIAVIVAGFLLYEILRPQGKSGRCTKCGKEIENDKWRICPICGNSLVNKKG